MKRAETVNPADVVVFLNDNETHSTAVGCHVIYHGAVYNLAPMITDVLNDIPVAETYYLCSEENSGLDQSK